MTPWPKDAFFDGVEFIGKIKPKVIPHMLIKGVHEDIQIDQSLIQQLEQQGLFNPTRIINQKSSKPTNIIKVTPHSRELIKQLTHVMIVFTRLKIESQKSVIQCFKCQRFGHTQSDCKASQRCLKCSGEHSHKNCKEANNKCANCGGEHTKKHARSRKNAKRK